MTIKNAKVSPDPLPHSGSTIPIVVSFEGKSSGNGRMAVSVDFVLEDFPELSFNGEPSESHDFIFEDDFETHEQELNLTIENHSEQNSSIILNAKGKSSSDVSATVARITLT